MAILIGTVIQGRGLAADHLRELNFSDTPLNGINIFPGSMNVILQDPIMLNSDHAITFDDGQRYLWPAKLLGIDIWLYRWEGCPYHVIEILSSKKLRKHFGINDGDHISIEVESSFIKSISIAHRAIWFTLWCGRKKWYYGDHPFHAYVTRASSRIFGTCQINEAAMGLNELKRALTKFPGGTKTLNYLKGVKRRIINPYVFERTKGDERDHDIRSAINLLNYTKTSNSSYSAKQWQAGYHTIKVKDIILSGQRDPEKRISSVPFDFNGKTVLDIGCNQGGMLHCISHKIAAGIGVDYDYKMINAANRISDINNTCNLKFYVFNIDKDPLDLLKDFIPNERADIIFLLSVCMWVKEWRKLIDTCTTISNNMLFESNGSPLQQKEQIDYIKQKYSMCEQLASQSTDDSSQKNRKLFICTNPY